MHDHAAAVPIGAAGARRPAWEVADVFRHHGEAFRRTHRLTPDQARVLDAVMRCRTAALGGHLDVCPACGYARPVYNSCRDRHCPTCQGAQAVAWIARRLDRLVPTHHFHVVFTLPAPLRALSLANPRLVYDLLFEAATAALLELAADRWQAQPGITAVLHTWTRAMDYHPHLHCVVTGGGLSLDGTRWVSCRKNFLFPVRVLGALVRGKLLDGLRRAAAQGELRFVGGSAELSDPDRFRRLLDGLSRTPWVVYAKRPFGGPAQVIRYLGRYTHRVALSSSRLVSLSDTAVVFRTRGARTVTLAPPEFLRRFLLHVLPKGLRKIRHYGLLAPAHVRTRLVTAQRLAAGANTPPHTAATPPASSLHEAAPAARRCPSCHAAELRRDVLPPRARPPPEGP